MVKTEEVRHADLRRALSDPVRLRILEALWEGPKTAKALAAGLGMVTNRLYYHLRTMEDTGLIGVVGTEVVGRFAERVYGARFLGFGDELAGDPSEERAAFLAAMFQATADEIGRAASRPGAVQGTARGVLRTTPTKLAELRTAIDRLLRDAYSAGADPDAHDYRFAYALYELNPPQVEDRR